MPTHSVPSRLWRWTAASALAIAVPLATRDHELAWLGAGALSIAALLAYAISRSIGLPSLARWLNPIVVGWMNYYGRFYRSAMIPLLRRVSSCLRRWAGKKYKRLRAHKRFKRWWAGLLAREPGLFAQWKWVRGF